MMDKAVSAHASVTSRHSTLSLRTTPFRQHIFDFCFVSMFRASKKDRLHNSNRPLVSVLHSGPRVNRTLAPRSLDSDFRSKVDQDLRASV